MLRLAQNARIPTLGEYETRKGFDFHSDAAGEAIDVQQTSTTGAADASFNTLTRIAKRVTFTTTGRCTRLDVRLKNDAAATGVVMVELYTNTSGAPGTLVARSSITGSDVDSSYAYETARLAEAPSVTATDFWCVVYVQSTGSGSYKISSTTNASTGLTSSDSGATWDAASVDFNVKAYLSTTGGVKGIHRAYKSDGTKVSLMAQGTVLYSVNEVTGALTSIKTGLNASATSYSFVTINDITYYCNGFDGLRKLTGASFGTDAQVNTTNYSILVSHKGMLFGVRKDDPNRVDFSNFGDYETFTSTDFIYVPSPKTGDPIASARSLNGYLLIRTKTRAYILSGDDNSTFRLDDAPDQKGTFTQETTTSDKNYEYFLSDDGVYKSNGTQPVLISDNNYDDVINIENKDDACLAISRGRLYLWFTSDGASANDQCFVWNLNYATNSEVVESFDTDAFVSRAFTAFNDDDALLVGSSLVGQVYWQELDSNDYTNIGGDIDFIIQTHYMIGVSPAVYKEIRFWMPRFEAQSGSYQIACEYATDRRDNWQTYYSQDVQGSGYLWGDSDTVWGAFTWGTTAELQSSLYVPGEYRRIALRYKHYATRQPNKFLGHTLVMQNRRLK